MTASLMFWSNTMKNTVAQTEIVDVEKLISELEEEMHEAAKKLDFERISVYQ